MCTVVVFAFVEEEEEEIALSYSQSTAEQHKLKGLWLSSWCASTVLVLVGWVSPGGAGVVLRSSG